MAPGAAEHIHLELVASVPGTNTAPASRAYRDDTDVLVRWAPPPRSR